MTTRLIRESGAVQINKSWFVLFLVYLLTSCAVVRLEDVKELPGKERVVFGRIKVIEEGQPKDWGVGGGFLVHIIPDAGPEPIPYGYYLTGNGSFYWDLPAGDYIITEFERPVSDWTPGFGYLGHKSVRRGILARFVIPEAMSPIYVGTLTIRSEAGRYTMVVEDEYDLALQRLKQQFPEVRGPVAKRLMRLELR